MIPDGDPDLAAGPQADEQRPPASGQRTARSAPEAAPPDPAGPKPPTKGRRATMRDVAALAGVSLSTVSRVVNASPGVRPDLVEQVRDAVTLLGYRHNITARTLRRSDKQSASIGLVFEDVSNPFFSAVHRGVEDVARARGVLVLVGSSDEEPDRERELAEAFGARGVDGMIIASAAHDHGYLHRDVAAGLALVFVDRPAGFIDADSVVTDNFGGAAAGVAHLIAAGHRRIGYLGDRPDVYTAAERLRGYRAELERLGLRVDPALVRHPRFRGVDAGERTRELLARPDAPTALFTSQNLITIEAVRALHQLGLHHQVALVGFDDIPLADVLEPGVTVVAQDPQQLGRSAAELLFSRLDGYHGPSRRVVVPATLMARGSGELAPAAAAV